MVPFETKVPGNSQRSFPYKDLSLGIGQWNYYYFLAINGEDITGGNNCVPKTGFLCLESEGAPIDLKGSRIRELP